MKFLALFFVLFALTLASCQKESNELKAFPTVPTAFCVKGDFSIDLPNIEPADVREVSLDIRTAVDDTFKITIYGRDNYLYLTMNYNEAIRQNLMTWIVSGNDCLNMVRGTVNEKIEGYVNVIYDK